MKTRMKRNQKEEEEGDHLLHLIQHDQTTDEIYLLMQNSMLDWENI